MIVLFLVGLLGSYQAVLLPLAKDLNVKKGNLQRCELSPALPGVDFAMYKKERLEVLR